MMRYGPKQSAACERAACCLSVATQNLLFIVLIVVCWVPTSRIYTHALKVGGAAAHSPLESLPGTVPPQSSRW